MKHTIPLACLIPLAAAAAPIPEDPPERPWTLMVYGAADNNADGPILDFARALEARFSLRRSPEGKKLVVAGRLAFCTKACTCLPNLPVQRHSFKMRTDHCDRQTILRNRPIHHRDVLVDRILKMMSKRQFCDRLPL